MRLTLIHPPLDDPTQPYHSLAYLAGQLDHNGFKDFEPTYGRFDKWQAEQEPLNCSENSSYWIVFDDRFAQLGKGVYKIIQMSSQEGLTIGKILAAVNSELAPEQSQTPGKKTSSSVR